MLQFEFESLWEEGELKFFGVALVLLQGRFLPSTAVQTVLELIRSAKHKINTFDLKIQL